FVSEYDYDLRLESYEDSDYILCASEFVKRSFLERGFADEKLLKVNFGFKTFSSDNHQSAPKGKDDVFRVLYVGQLHFRKGLRYAIEAFKQLKHPNKEFFIVGPKTTITGLENVSIPDGVTFTGVLKGEDLAEQYRQASLFVLPSLEEGLALVQGEALSFGIPLLITTNTGGEDIITNGKEGFIVPPADTQALLEKMQLVADDPLLREEMSANAFETTSSLGSWDAAGAKLVSELTRIAEKKSNLQASSHVG
ncbi:MAG: glycosyltransferase family 4 protein, partial [Lewinella sp.]